MTVEELQPEELKPEEFKKELKSRLNNHWSFRLFDAFPKLHYVVIALLVSTGIYLLGLVIFTLVGEFKAYVTSLLPYMFFSGFFLVILSYGWWRDALVGMLVTVQPALEAGPRKFIELTKTWNQKWINSIWAGILFAFPFAVMNLRDVLMIWTKGIPPEFQGWFAQQAWGVWISSAHKVLFGVWYGLLHIGLEAFVLGSGVAGIIATIVLIRMIRGYDLKLAYYRRLDAIVSMASNLAFWVLIALTAVALLSRPTLLSMSGNLQTMLSSTLSPDTLAIIFSTVIQVVLAFLTLIGIFGIPLFMCHEMIKETKTAYLADLLGMSEKLYSAIRDLSLSPITPEEQTNAKTQKLEDLHKQLNVVNSWIEEIEKIPAWPVTVLSSAQVVSGFVASIVSPIAMDWATNAIKGLL